MPLIQSIHVTRDPTGTGRGPRDVVTVTISGLPFSCDLTGSRHLLQVVRLAEAHGVRIAADEHNTDRLAAALQSARESRQQGGDTIQRIHLSRLAKQAEEYDAATLLIADMRLTCPIRNDDQLRTIHRMAIECGLGLLYTPAMAERVNLAVSQGA